MRTSIASLALATLLTCGCGTSALGTDLATNADAAGSNDQGVTSPPDAATDLATGCPSPMAAPGLAVVESGGVQGTLEGSTWAFKGIPFAAPPTGSLRFRPPAPAACFNGTFDASKYGNTCLQLDANNNVLGDEDCLTLDVFTPKTAPAQPAPVMVFIHGGGNTTGSSSEQQSGVSIYDPEAIVEASGSVVVTINYRLGLFGFFALPALDAESANHVSGNYGLLDQIAALEWVKRNITAFGGDAKKVMIFGESAGAVDVCMLLVSPLSQGLFNSALMESGGCPGITLAATEAQDTALLPTVGCDNAMDVAACLRALPAAMLTKSLPGVVSVSGLDPGTKYGPNVDGYVLPALPMQMLKQGMHAQVPFVIGSNSDETSRSVPAVANAQAYQTLIVTTYGQTLGNQILAEYPAADFATPRAALVAVTTDSRFICPTRMVTRYMASTQQSKVYRYLFAHALDSGPLKAFGAWHGLELLWVFKHLTIAGYVPSQGETQLADSMIGYWTRFAASADPNGGGSVPWPVYDPATDPYLNLDDTISAMAGLRTAKCDFWEKLIP